MACKGETLILCLVLLVASTRTVIRAETLKDECPYSSFTWVGHQKDNPYFWKSPDFDWSSTSTLGVFGDIEESADRSEMRDYAQALGIKVVVGTSPSDIDMNNETARQAWVTERVEYAQSKGLDGLNLDYEGHKPSDADGYSKVAVETCEAVHASIDGGVVSVDVPVYPHYEGRNYDYARLGASCDALFVMAYDGEFWDNVQCGGMATVNCSLACAPLQAVEFGVQQYLALGVPAEKIFLGLPWYGLKYETIAKIPFFTGQIDYQDVLDVMASVGTKGKLTFDDASSTWIFDCGGLCRQWTDLITDRTDRIWFDDAVSLAPKYALGTKYSLGGVGMWEANKVAYDPNGTLPEPKAMWDALCQR